MDDDGWRLLVKLKSRQAMYQFAEFQGLLKPDRSINAYALARKAGLKVGVVGHLVSGRRNTCSVRTARAIEEALGCPPGFFFEAQMSQVSDDSRYKAAA